MQGKLAGAGRNRTYQGPCEPQLVLKTSRTTRPDPPPCGFLTVAGANCTPDVRWRHVHASQSPKKWPLFVRGRTIPCRPPSIVFGTRNDLEVESSRDRRSALTAKCPTSDLRPSCDAKIHRSSVARAQRQHFVCRDGASLVRMVTGLKMAQLLQLGARDSICRYLREPCT